MWRRLVRGFWGRQDAGKGPWVLGTGAGAGGRGVWGPKEKRGYILRGEARGRVKIVGFACSCVCLSECICEVAPERVSEKACGVLDFATGRVMQACMVVCTGRWRFCD